MSQQRTVLVTGAAGGIGQAIVKALAAKDYVVLAGVRERTAALGGARQIVMDVTDPESVADAAEQVDGGLHAVINNAGVIVQGPLELVPPGELRRQFEVNTYGPTYVMQAFLPMLRAGRGRIINISAPTARVPLPFLAPISASKAALASLSDALRLELAAWGIPIVLIEPGTTSTPIFAKAEAAARAAAALAEPDRLALYGDHLARLAQAMAEQKPGSVEPVANAVVAAVEARNPKRRYVVGDARLADLLTRLPVRLRERMVMSALGLTGVRP
ncbi:SDR family NAD(P)-dependent oxidoreductase [Sphaerisporangium fuscum]|uniref:SDR family NAD(P)-dependent oxidoreductase n=1 Tax=Sphaerisporangium fuscum TaxID=2835868 RepID=UPI001BDC4854|nr:SDR family NAD(P)-dependent oxidoreductase [Sphaerisporangium fuscum]